MKIHTKQAKLAAKIIFVLVVIRKKKGEISIRETKLGVSGNVTYAYLFPTLSLTNLMGYFHEQPSSSDIKIIANTKSSGFFLLTTPIISWLLMITEAAWL